MVVADEKESHAWSAGYSKLSSCCDEQLARKSREAVCFGAWWFVDLVSIVATSSVFR